MAKQNASTFFFFNFREGLNLISINHILTKRLYFPGADGLGIEIQNTVDIEKTHNFELVMRLATNIDSKDEFFTDVNGYQVKYFRL